VRPVAYAQTFLDALSAGLAYQSVDVTAAKLGHAFSFCRIGEECGDEVGLGPCSLVSGAHQRLVEMMADDPSRPARLGQDQISKFTAVALVGA